MTLQAAQAKKEKEALKKAMRKERRKLREACKVCRYYCDYVNICYSSLFPQEHNYFADSEGEVVTRMQELESLCEALTLERLADICTSSWLSTISPTLRLQEVNERFLGLPAGEARSAFEDEVGNGVHYHINLMGPGPLSRWQLLREGRKRDLLLQHRLKVESHL